MISITVYYTNGTETIDDDSYTGSNFNSDSITSNPGVEFVAPGYNVQTVEDLNGVAQNIKIGGTSFSAPFVAATAVIIFQVCKTVNPTYSKSKCKADTYSALKESAEGQINGIANAPISNYDASDHYSAELGWGIPDLYDALKWFDKVSPSQNWITISWSGDDKIIEVSFTDQNGIKFITLSGAVSGQSGTNTASGTYVDAKYKGYGNVGITVQDNFENTYSVIERIEGGTTGPQIGNINRFYTSSSYLFFKVYISDDQAGSTVIWKVNNVPKSISTMSGKTTTSYFSISKNIFNVGWNTISVTVTDTGQNTVSQSYSYYFYYTSPSTSNSIPYF